MTLEEIENRQQLIRDVIEKEHQFIDEMQNLFQIYLEPLESGANQNLSIFTVYHKQPKK